VVSIPRVVIAAPSSGAGKTTVATGLMAALTTAGLRVSPHKIGPDYIDPGYHALATGRPGRNLDPVMVGEERVAPLFLHGSQGADIAVIEGVMGLYDGRAATPEGSTAHVAGLLDAPVILVVDASSQSRSVAALVHGFASFDVSVRFAGVILNRVASDRHEQVLRESLRGVPVLGVLRRDAAIATPSRHLGLVPVAERSAEAMATVARLGALLAASVDLGEVRRIACSAGDLPGTVWTPETREPRPSEDSRPLIAVAGGRAFTFAYAELSECIDAAGGDVVVVDPLRDRQLPEGTRGLVLPGGFPEVYAAELSANEPFLASVREHVDAGRVTYAECAGLLALCTSLDGAQMAGCLEAEARMTPQLNLGYRTVTAVGDNLAGPAASVVTGHEFHRTTVEPGYGARPAWRREDGAFEGFSTGTSLLASYLHLHPAGVPGLARRILDRAASPLAGVA
jgi:cobyrinic acid a,c-diamide synthase